MGLHTANSVCYGQPATVEVVNSQLNSANEDKNHVVENVFERLTQVRLMYATISKLKSKTFATSI